MFWRKKPIIEESVQRKLLEFSDNYHELKRDIEDIKDKLEKLDIKILESRKIYQRKLKNLVGDEESETSKDIYNGVLLPE